MRLFFDTSVLIPAFLEDHEHHEPSFEALRSTDKREGFCGAHSLAEVYSTLTRLPAKHRMSGEQAALMVEQIRDRFTIVALDPDEYYLAPSRMPRQLA